MLDQRDRPSDIDATISPVHQSKTSRLLNWVVAGALVLATLGLIRILSWALDTTPVLEVNNAPFPTRTIREHPTAGGVVILDVDYCKTHDIKGELRVSFIGTGREIFLPLSEERGPVGCNRQELPVLIPADVPAGEYRIKFRAEYDKNPLKQNERIEFESQKFIIDPTN